MRLTVSVIRLENVRKEYGELTALDGVNLSVESGEVYGFLGPNGAGKSTTINIILDFARPTAGTATVFGMDATEESQAIRDRIGVLPEGLDLYGRLTARQHLEFVRESKGVPSEAIDFEAIVERVGIPEAIDRKVSGFSKGMQQRLALGAALIGDPELIILDEPSSGLDPEGVRTMRKIILEEVDRGATVFFSSHILDQVEAVCDRVGILRDGELVAQGPISELQSSMGGEAVLEIETADSQSGAISAVESVAGVSNVSTNNGTVTVQCSPPAKIDVLNTIQEAGVTVEDFSLDEQSLESLFMSYTNGESAEKTEVRA